MVSNIQMTKQSSDDSFQNNYVNMLQSTVDFWVLF